MAWRLARGEISGGRSAFHGRNMASSFGVHFPAGTDMSSVVAVYPTQLLEVFWDS